LLTMPGLEWQISEALSSVAETHLELTKRAVLNWLDRSKN